MAQRKKKKPAKKWTNGRKPLRTARLNMMLEPGLKTRMHAYARRHSKSLSSIITDHFTDLLDKETELDVEQI